MGAIMDGMPRTPELPSERVYRELRELVQGMASGTVLPPVRELAASYDTSSETVRRTLRRLADEGQVQIRPRWGTFRI